jgi:CRISPR-associated endonuclease/helicase Cas3
LISRNIAPQDPVRKAAFDAALESLPGRGKWSVLLALEKTDEEWIGEAGNGPDDQKGGRKHWSYSEELGLHERKTPESISPA